MKTLLVSALALLAVAAAESPASAQSFRLGASVRLSDDVTLGFSYRPRGRVSLWTYAGYRSAWQRRHSRRHRVYERTHDRWHAQVEREHRQVHRDYLRGYISRRDLRRWHEIVGYEHADLHDDLNDRHDDDHGHGRDGYVDRRIDDRRDRPQRPRRRGRGRR